MHTTVLLVPVPLLAMASGLNNIPTAGTTGKRTLVIQDYPTCVVGRRPDYGAGDAGPAVMQVKYTTEPDPQGPAFYVGVANLAFTLAGRRRAGQTFSYFVVTEGFVLKSWVAKSTNGRPPAFTIKLNFAFGL